MDYRSRGILAVDRDVRSWPISVDLAIEVAGKKEYGNQRHTECKPTSWKPVRAYQNSEDDRGDGGRKNRVTVSGRDFHRGEWSAFREVTATALRPQLADRVDSPVSA